MNKIILLITLIFSSFSAQASNLINDERIKDQINCFSSIYENYDSWRGFMEMKYKKRSKSKEALSDQLSWFDSMFGEEEFNKYKKNLSCKAFTYQVDGNDVHGYVVKPKKSAKKLPVLVYNRGGNGPFGSVQFGSMMHNLFPIANEGFVIIGSQYRGSQYPGTRAKNVMHDEFGGKDVKDVTELLDYIPKIEGADPQRIGMYGFSRGGMQTHLALKQVKNVKAIATIAGSTDLLQELNFRPAMEKVYTHRIPDYETNKVTELEKRSVINWVNELSSNVPILLLHGEDDKRISANSSVELADALAKKNIPHKLVIYSKDDHDLTKNKDKANKELVNWFNMYL
ncbi:peptidase [Pseudoalteromonas sp. MSK9-3]|uniref:alpha/beta hydrolase family protein n=1 Tax=Pseudoalteromonas sp. MSK9-3 TaxID=1897633 RepID=UPI000E6D4DC0|nr:prolyl oligopeptidase family serine peptidase [Pseudoalteromonas sp. MSK9-3]RJE70732.1 peptidase [Pseudoalteromonas sp. MSK9-3]